MFKYILNPQLRYELFEEKPYPYFTVEWANKKFLKKVKLWSDIGGDKRDVFSFIAHLEQFNYYCSPKELQFVPVGGWLIPVEYFEKEIIS